MHYSRLCATLFLTAASACMATPDEAETDADDSNSAQAAVSPPASEDDVDLGVTDEALVFGNDDVGVIKAAGTNCPFGERVYIMDNENSDNNNGRSGWIGATTSNHNTTLRFCVAPGFLFKQVPSGNAAHNYAVLKLGPSCPAGSVLVRRRFDCDDNNTNNSGVDDGGNVMVDGNWTLHFCMFVASPVASPNFSWINLGVPYGVLGGSGLLGTLESGWIRTDDEDRNNNNQFFAAAGGWQTFLQVGANTRMSMARVR